MQGSCLCSVCVSPFLNVLSSALFAAVLISMTSTDVQNSVGSCQLLLPWQGEAVPRVDSCVEYLPGTTVCDFVTAALTVYCSRDQPTAPNSNN